jgi:FO synthase
MRDHPEPALDDMLKTLAVARLMLQADISLQAPPNLSERHIEYLAAGINDWGGISPVTIDYINPQHAWPDIDRLARSTQQAGCRLRERLTVYPAYLERPDRFLDPDIAERARPMAGADGLALDQAAMRFAGAAE